MSTLEKKGNIFILTLTGNNEHRLNPNLLDSIDSHLQYLSTIPPTSPFVLITTAEGKFFSNGYDLAWATTDAKKKLMSFKLRTIISKLLSLPLPTIAAVTGHACAGGMILALAHDFVLMRKDRGYLYMSEVDIGLVIPEWFKVILKCKIKDWNGMRDVVLMGEKLTAEMGFKRGIVYSCHDTAGETVDSSFELGKKLVKRGWNGDVYRKNRLVLLSDVMCKIEFDETVQKPNGDTNIKSNL